jgi:large subunit ribosomal protein L29|uniref:ribosomal protein L29 n=1 Tax=Cryptomonas gyropyrenoidosa TaxID=233257 RepID=UPI00279F0A7C|nr:ribosomal protein L29 [Cryptomonas gyropyrenoidosa]WFQ83007.1 ribosomal protein L29 [Cryptomonas gyropyrenoidosa]
MPMSDFSSIQNLSSDTLMTEITTLKKELFNLRLKKVTRQPFKAHLFKHTKRKIAQILTLQSKTKQI